ncbi:hypothetical protein HMPREF1582_00459 [Gardnerella vaginalis JCP8151A]|nr:hypothetical protein HMPREF1582_00459 [Gardnerella vaginalis JCP8151A]
MILQVKNNTHLIAAIRLYCNKLDMIFYTVLTYNFLICWYIL